MNKPDWKKGPVQRWERAYELARDLVLGKDEAAVLGYIACRDGGRGAWPSIALIAESVRYDPRSVKRALRSLCERGLLTRTERPGKTTVYRFRG